MIKERTEVLIGAENTVRRTLEDFPLIKEKRLNSCIDKLGPSILIATEPVKNALIDLKERGIQIKYITEITRDNLQYCKQLAKIVGEMRHLSGVKGYFAVTEFSYIGTATNQEAIPVPQLIFSTVKAFVEQQQYFFDMLWSKSIPAKQRIKEIEEGVTPPFIETIYDPDEIRKIELDLLRGAKNEVLMILPSSAAFEHHKKEGLLQLLKEKVDKQKSKVRILSRLDDKDTETDWLNKEDNFAPNQLRIKDHLSTEEENFTLQVMDDDQQQTKLITIIVDKSRSLVFELRDNITDDNFWKGIGLAIFSNSKSTVLSYVSTFETIWFQTQLLTQLY